jgi:CheY-like chemotaxis protein
MPRMRGTETTRNIRGMGYSGIGEFYDVVVIDVIYELGDECMCIVIGVTGNVLRDDVEEFLAYGADRVLPKPLDMDEFKRNLDEEWSLREIAKQQFGIVNAKARYHL